MKRILVIKLRHHGDVLLTTALFRALADHFPQAQVDALVYQETTPLLENNPHLGRVWTIDRKVKGFKRLRAEVQLIRNVRRAGYDAVLHLTDQWIGALLARFSRAPKRISMAFAKRQSKFWLNSFTDTITPPSRGEAHAVQLNLLCLPALGVDPKQVKGQMALMPSEQTVQAAQAKLDDAALSKPFVLVHPAARWPFKCWEDDRFAQVVALILNEGIDVVLSCSPNDTEVTMTKRIESLARGLAKQSSAKLVNWGGQLSLPVLAALIQGCRFYVGVDSAPMHMAAALDKPQVALFGPSWVDEWRPWSEQAQVIYAGDYGPLPHPDSINTDDPTRLLSAIPVEVVCRAVQGLVHATG